MTLTTRLLVFFVGTLAVVLIGFSAGVYLLAHDHLIPRRVDVDDIQRLRPGDPDAASLADGVTMNAGVMAHDCTTGIYYLAFAWQALARVFRFKVAIDEAGVVPIGNKTDFLRLRFLCHREPVRARHFPHFRL